MQRQRHRSLYVKIFGALVCATLAHPLVAAEPPQGKISVNGIGTAEIKPDVAEVHTSVVGNATLASDAIRKYRDNRRRAFELLHKSDVKGLVVEGRGPLVTSVTTNPNQQNGAVFFNFNGAGQANTQTVGMNCTESLVVRVPQIDRMKHEDVIDAVVKILDVCKDAGMIVASVEFKSTQMETYKTSAIRAAVDAARHKAELLAGLAHARVGPVLSIQETSAAQAGLENLVQAASDSDTVGTINGMNIQVAASNPLAAITVRAAVNVEFALERGN
ncbi:MAG TPA: SIMPL domain-containing protein [Planctomycetaceae bacterium]|jgi:uncharacterized protein YggE|nr:SIMPL domain-containing protein [Planctomycetaceae bacterium]